MELFHQRVSRFTVSYDEDKKVGAAGLKPTRYDNSKGPRIGPSYFLHQNYIANISNNLNSRTVRPTKNKPTQY